MLKYVSTAILSIVHPAMRINRMGDTFIGHYGLIHPRAAWVYSALIKQTLRYFISSLLHRNAVSGRCRRRDGGFAGGTQGDK